MNAAASAKEGAHLRLLLAVLFCVLMTPFSAFAQGAGLCRCCGSTGCPCDTPKTCPLQHPAPPPTPPPCSAEQDAVIADENALDQDDQNLLRLGRQSQIAITNLINAIKAHNGSDANKWLLTETSIKNEEYALLKKINQDEINLDNAIEAFQACSAGEKP
jgi:hypothetical protein